MSEVDWKAAHDTVLAHHRETFAELRSDIDRVTAERDALQALLTAADERADVLEGLAVKQAALLDELGIPLDEVDDLFGETLKNAKRYEYVRSVMAVENFPAPHPAWSEPSEVESKRIDDLCDAALKPAEGGGDHVKHYECIGKGGDYTVVAIAQGAGTLKGFNHYIYKNADGVHFVRDPEDFLSRMQIKP